MGHRRVSVLDGGVPGWLRKNYALVDGADDRQTAFATKPMSTTATDLFAAKFQPQLYAAFDRVCDVASGKEKCSLVDCRPPGAYAPGHIKSAVNLPAAVFMDEATLCLKKPEQLRKLLPQQTPLISSCQTGMRACAGALAAAVAGLPFSVYDGSWSEFVDRATDDLKGKSA